MTFDEMLLRDNAVFLSDFAEAVVYTPRGGTAKTIMAVVDRQLDEQIKETAHALTDFITVTISKADIPTVTRDGDTVRLKPILGGADATLKVRQIVMQDEGQWKLLVA